MAEYLISQQAANFDSLLATAKTNAEERSIKLAEAAGYNRAISDILGLPGLLKRVDVKKD